MFTKLRQQITLTLLVIVAIIFGIAIATFISVRYKIEYDEIVNNLTKSQIENVPGGFGEREKGLFSISNTYTILVNSDGEIITRPSEDIDSSILEAAKNIVCETAKNISLVNGELFGRIKEYSLIYKCEVALDGYVMTFASTENLEQELSAMIMLGICFYVSILIIFYFVSYFLAKAIVRPVKESWETQKQFVQDASHDLKTPLTVILANQDIVLSGENRLVKDEKEWIESTKEEALMMKNLVEKMLESAKSENLKNTLKFSECNVSDLTEKVSLQFDAIAFDKNIILEENIEKNVMHKSSETEYVRLVHILIDNALKYSPPNETVKVTLTKTKFGFIFSVNNKGEVISENDLKHLFERFYRTDKARSSGGYGLGLSIAKNISKALGGKINVKSSFEEGTTFKIVFK